MEMHLNGEMHLKFSASRLKVVDHTNHSNIQTISLRFMPIGFLYINYNVKTHSMHRIYKKKVSPKYFAKQDLMLNPIH